MLATVEVMLQSAVNRGPGRPVTVEYVEHLSNQRASYAHSRQRTVLNLSSSIPHNDIVQINVNFLVIGCS